MNNHHERCYPFLGSHKKLREYKKISKKIFRRNPKIIGARKGCRNAEKCQNWLRRFKNVKGWNLTMRALLIRKIQIWGRKFQNQIFMDSIKFYPRFNSIYGGFDCNKIEFWSQFRFLLEEIKVLGSNYNFEELIWSKQGLNCIIIEVWWPIRDLIETIRNQGPNQKNAKIKGSNYNSSGGLITKLH